MINDRERFEAAVAKFLDGVKNGIGEAYEPVKYALTNGGKRVRPSLMLISARMLSVSEKEILPYALSLECIHTYSLIHDDMPSLDNDDFRRGLPSVHKKFGEGLALVAGDGLLNLAYEILFENKSDTDASLFIARAAGLINMAGGQADELFLAEKIKDMPEKDAVTEILNVYKRKTGALIAASVYVPFILSKYSKDSELGKKLLTLAENTGLIFQLADDLIDAESSPSILIKNSGKNYVKALIEKLDKENAEIFADLPLEKEELIGYINSLSVRYTSDQT